MSATLAAPNQRLDRTALGLLAIGHLSADFCQGTVPAMLPFLVQERHLSYAAAAGLVLGQTVSSSVVQPIFGRLSDRWPMPWLLPAGLLLAGAGIGLSTQLHAYAAVWLAIAASGLGIAAFHPEGARYARRASGARRVTGMSVFSVGGNAGFALGPLVTTPLLLLFGLEGGWVLGLLPVAVAGALLAGRRRVTHPATLDGATPRAAATPVDPAVVAAPDRWGPFGRLTGALVVRSIVFYGLNTFVPLFWVGVLGQSKAAGGAALTVLLVAGAIGTLVAGRLADRFSRRLVSLIGFAALAPLLLALTASDRPLLSLAILIPLAFALYLPTSPMIVMGQEYLSRHIGTASGMTLGLAVSVGGIVTPAVGAAADRVGLRMALLGLVALPLIAAALTLTLPRDAALKR